MQLQARLSRVIVSGHQLYTDLKVGISTHDIIEGLGLMLKVSLKDQPPPLTVQFTYPNREDEQFIEGFYSCDFREPRPGLGEVVSKVSPSLF